MLKLSKLISIIVLISAGSALIAMDEGRSLTAIESPKGTFPDDIIFNVIPDLVHTRTGIDTVPWDSLKVSIIREGRHEFYKPIDLETTKRYPALIVTRANNRTASIFGYDDLDKLPGGRIKLVIDARGLMSLQEDV